MITEKCILQWLFLYSCKKKYDSLFETFAKHTDLLNLVTHAGDHALVASATVYVIVKNKEIEKYDKLSSILKHIRENCPSVIDEDTYLNLILALAFKYIMNELRLRPDDALAKFRKFLFNDLLNVTEDLASDLKNSVLIRISKFRFTFYTLFNQPDRRLTYFEGKYYDEYGDDFDSELFRYMSRFCREIELNLPPTKLELLMSEDNVYDRSHNYGSALDILFIFLENKSVLSPTDVSHLIDVFSPHDNKVTQNFSRKSSPAKSLKSMSSHPVSESSCPGSPPAKPPSSKRLPSYLLSLDDVIDNVSDLLAEVTSGDDSLASSSSRSDVKPNVAEIDLKSYSTTLNRHSNAQIQYGDRTDSATNQMYIKHEPMDDGCNATLNLCEYSSGSSTVIYSPYLENVGQSLSCSSDEYFSANSSVDDFVKFSTCPEILLPHGGHCKGREKNKLKANHSDNLHLPALNKKYPHNIKPCLVLLKFLKKLNSPYMNQQPSSYTIYS